MGWEGSEQSAAQPFIHPSLPHWCQQDSIQKNEATVAGFWGRALMGGLEQEVKRHRSARWLTGPKPVAAQGAHGADK